VNAQENDTVLGHSNTPKQPGTAPSLTLAAMLLQGCATTNINLPAYYFLGLSSE
jgi:hypothetical protein